MLISKFGALLYQEFYEVSLCYFKTMDSIPFFYDQMGQCLLEKSDLGGPYFLSKSNPRGPYFVSKS